MAPGPNVPDPNAAPVAPREVNVIENDLAALKVEVDAAQNDTPEQKEGLKQKKERLKQELNQKELIATDAEKVEIERIEREILNEIEAEIEGNDPVAVSPAASNAPATFAERIGHVAGRIGEALGKFQKMITEMFGKMGSSTLRGLRTLAGAAGMGRFAEMINNYIEPTDIREMMSKTLNKPIKASAEDSDVVKKLHAMHESILEADKENLNPANFSFEKFCQQKVDELKDSGKTEFTLADLLTAKSPDEVKKEPTTEEQKIVGKAQEKAEELANAKKQIAENPEARNAASIFALAKAMNDTVPGFITLEPKLDVTDKEYSKKVATMIMDKMKYIDDGETYEKPSTLTTFGIELDDGDIEQSDGTNWFYDPDKVIYFEANMYNHAELAVRQLLDATFDGGIAKTQMPRLQKALLKRLEEYGIETPDEPANEAEAAPEKAA